METGDVIRVKTLTTIRRNAVVQSEVKYRPPKGTEFVLLVLGAAPPERDISEMATTMLNALGWELQSVPSSAPTQENAK